MTRADESAWREYVAVELGRFYEHTDGITYIWVNTEAAARVIAKLGGDAELASFRGPWHVIRKHLTTEFRQWVEEYEGTERHTPTEWRAASIAARSEVAFTESAEHTLGQLAELRRLTAERDALIVEASKRGASKVAIAASVGLSRQQIHTIVGAADIAPIIPIRAEFATDGRMTADGMTASGEWAGEPF